MLGFVPNSLNLLLHACKWISNYFRQCWWRFRVNSKGSEIGRFWPKSLGYSPWFWKWRIWVSVGIRSKLPEFLLYACKCISNYFRQCWWRFRVNSKGSEIGRFWPKSLGYSPWFWKWRIWVSVGIRSKLPKSPPTCLQMYFQLLSTMLVKISGEFQRVRNRPILTKKPGL